MTQSNPRVKDGVVVRHPYIHIAGGKRLVVCNPTPDMVDVRAIAYGISKECRYAGQIEDFYSVAQHSVLMRDYAKAHNLLPAHELIYVLRHDAAEFAIGDVPKPYKLELPDFNRKEEELLAVIDEHFGLETNERIERVVKELDTRILVDEASQLFSHTPEWLDDFHEAGIDPLGIHITPWTWERSLYFFAECFAEDYSAFLKHNGCNPDQDNGYFKWEAFDELVTAAFVRYITQNRTEVDNAART